MAPRPKWWHTLQEARRQALLGVDFYNRPGDKRSFYDFVVHMHLAWQNLLHADLERHKIGYYYRDKQGRYVKGKDGERRTWDLQECLKREYQDNNPVRSNVEFFIGLRNKIEHRFQDAFLVATAAHAHALVINFESELVTRFGDVASLGHELRFPVFVQSLTPSGVQEQQKLRRRLPAAARSYITKFEAKLDAAVRDDERYLFRVRMTPVQGPRSDADLAVTFVRADALTPEELQRYHSEQVGTVIMTEKHRDIGLKDEMLQKQAAAAIEARLPFELPVHLFTALRKKHGVRPTNAQDHALADTRYCIFSKPHGNYVYTQAYVDRCVRELDTRDKFRQLLGVEPHAKVSNLADKSGARKTDHSGSLPA